MTPNPCSRFFALAACAIAAFYGCTAMSRVEAGEVEKGFPSKPLKIIVPYAKGGGLDVSSRIMAKYAAPILGEMIDVENITQGGNVRGYLKAIQSDPDGYTLSAWGNGLVTDSILIKNAPYSYHDVKPLCLFANDPHIIVVSKEFAEDAGINALEDLFEYARLHPGIVSIGVGGNWTTHDFMRMKMERIAKVKFNRIPFLGGAPALQAAANGNCHVATPFVSELLGLQDKDKVIPLAVAYHDRIAQFPALASVPEVGYPGMTQSIWRVLALPKDTPEPIVQILESAFQQVIENPDFIDEARSLGVNPFFMGSEKLSSFLEKEFRFYSLKARNWNIGYESPAPPPATGNAKP